MSENRFPQVQAPTPGDHKLFCSPVWEAGTERMKHPALGGFLRELGPRPWRGGGGHGVTALHTGKAGYQPAATQRMPGLLPKHCTTAQIAFQGLVWSSVDSQAPNELCWTQRARREKGDQEEHRRIPSPCEASPHCAAAGSAIQEQGLQMPPLYPAWCRPQAPSHKHWPPLRTDTAKVPRAAGWLRAETQLSPGFWS